MKTTKYTESFPDLSQKTYEVKEPNWFTVLTHESMVHALAASLMLVIVTSCLVVIKEAWTPQQSIPQTNQIKMGEYNDGR